MKITRYQEQSAMIILLTELYFDTQKNWLSVDCLRKYTNFETLNNEELIFLINSAVSQLIDLEMIIVKSKLEKAGEYANVRMNGKAKILLDKIFGNESFIKFIDLKEKDKNNFTEYLYKKINEDGVDIFVSFIFEGFKEIYKNTLSSIIS